MLMTFKKILCPTDFSDASRLAVRVAADLAARDHGELRLVHVVEVEPPLPTDPNVVMEGPEYERTLHADAQLDDLAACYENLTVSTIVGHGDAGDEIVRIARDEAVDLIVMSTHGRTGLDRVVFGSVAEKVVRHAHRPVLTIPAPPAH
jgi:nucleotide-binding universal stress UspA family protein